jgi:chromosome segregation ATPase
VIESREREVSRREREIEIRQSEIQTTAHEEARLSVETQLDNLLREKASLMIERKRFEEEKASDTSLRLAISDMRAKHREMENEISDKEDQINALKTTLVRLQNSLVAEDKDVSKVHLSLSLICQSSLILTVS